MRNTIWLLDVRKVPVSKGEPTEHSEIDVAFSTIELRRQQKTLSRALLRTAAARQFQCDVKTVSLSERADNAPVVRLTNNSTPYVSLSHSGPWIVCVLGRTPIGIDIEWMARTRDVVAMSEWFFAESEHSWLLRQSDRTLAFYRLWTGKEAVLKLARATGQNSALRNVHFVIDGDTALPPPMTGALLHWHIAPGLPCSLATTADSAISTDESLAVGAEKARIDVVVVPVAPSELFFE